MGMGSGEIRASGSGIGAGVVRDPWEWRGFGHLWLVVLEPGGLRLSQSSSWSL